MTPATVPFHIGVNTLFLIPGEVGGTETYLRETLQAMARTHADLKVTLFTNRENDRLLRDLFGAYPQFVFDAIDVRATNRYARIIMEQVKVPRHAAAAGLDVLWSPGYTAPLCYRGRQVVTIHDMQYKRHPDDLTPLARFVTDVLVRGACRRCDGILADSEFTRREIMHFTRTPPDRITVTKLGVNTCFLQPAPDLTGGSRLIPAGEPYILCVANSYPHKNLAMAVEAFARLRHDLPHHLLIVGKPRLGEATLEAAIRREGGDRIIRVHGMPWLQLVAVYQQADMVLFPSLYEGFGLPVLEAQLAGVPVVSTRCASIPEVGGAHVRYADPVTPDSMAACMRDIHGWSPARRETWVADARAWAQTFTWEQCAGHTVAALRQAQRFENG